MLNKVLIATSQALDLDSRALASALAGAGIAPILGFDARLLRFQVPPSEVDLPEGLEHLGLAIVDGPWANALGRAVPDRGRVVVLSLASPDADPERVALDLQAKGWARGSGALCTEGLGAEQVARAAADALQRHRLGVAGQALDHVVLWFIDDDRTRLVGSGCWSALASQVQEGPVPVVVVASHVGPEALQSDGGTALLRTWSRELIEPLRRRGTPVVVVADNQFEPSLHFGMLGRRLCLLLSGALPASRLFLASAVDEGVLPERVESIGLLEGARGRSGAQAEPRAVERVQATLQAARAAGPLPVEPESPWRSSLGKMVGSSAAMQPVYRRLLELAEQDGTVLLRGPSGAGKELAARVLHEQGPRAGRPFVVVNCPGISTELFESELFGHLKGAFTGATANKPGLVDMAADGTLFFDEFGDLAPEHQARVLRFLQDRSYRAVGGTKDEESKARLVLATNRDLEGMVRSGELRDDLFRRVSAHQVWLPPFEDRGDDVVAIVQRLAGGATSHTAQALAAADWSGNGRQTRDVAGGEPLHRRPPDAPARAGDGLAAPFATFLLLGAAAGDADLGALLTERAEPAALYARVTQAVADLPPLGEVERARARVLLGWTVDDARWAERAPAEAVESWLERAWQRTCRAAGARTAARPVLSGAVAAWRHLLVGPSDPEDRTAELWDRVRRLVSPGHLMALCREPAWSDRVRWSTRARQGDLGQVLVDLCAADPGAEGAGGKDRNLTREAGRWLSERSGITLDGVPPVDAKLLGLLDVDRPAIVEKLPAKPGHDKANPNMVNRTLRYLLKGAVRS